MKTLLLELILYRNVFVFHYFTKRMFSLQLLDWLLFVKKSLDRASKALETGYYLEG